MEISWLGHSCFRLRGRDVTVVVDPCAPSTGYTLPRVTAEIVAVTHDHPGHNHVAGVGGTPRVVHGAGEYEIADVFITGIQTHHDSVNGQERGANTAYLIELDELSICHLGDVGHVLSPEQVEALQEADILFVPVGGTSTVNATTAADIVRLIDPKVVIPMHYRTEAGRPDLDPVDRFLAEMSQKELTPQPRVSYTKSSLPDTLQVVVLDYRRG